MVRFASWRHWSWNAAGGGGPLLSFECDEPLPADVQAPSPSWVNATGNLAGVVSECGNLDQGQSWQPIGEPLPYPGGGYDGARGQAYSAHTKTFYVWRWDCGDQVLPNAIMSAGFDYTTE